MKSALAVPAGSFAGMEAYPDLPAKAAAFAYALAKNHPCPDGNKRVALLLLVEFLSINGAELQATSEGLAEIILDMSGSAARERDRTLLEFTTWLEDHIVSLS